MRYGPISYYSLGRIYSRERLREIFPLYRYRRRFVLLNSRSVITPGTGNVSLTGNNYVVLQSDNRFFTPGTGSLRFVGRSGSVKALYPVDVTYLTEGDKVQIMGGIG